METLEKVLTSVIIISETLPFFTKWKGVVHLVASSIIGIVKIFKKK